MKFILAVLAASSHQSTIVPNKISSVRKLSICQDFKKQQRLAALEFKKFTQKHALPISVQSDVEISKAFDKKTKPSLISKGSNLEQIINAERLKNCININKLTLIDVAPHYITGIHNQWSVVMQPIEAQFFSFPHAPIKELVRQLAILSLETGFTQMINMNNWIYSKDKFFFTNTNSELFEKGEKIQNRSIGKFTQQTLHYTLEQGMYGEIFTQEEDIPYQQMVRFSPSATPLPRNYKLDSADINIQRVEQQLDYLGLRGNRPTKWNDSSNIQ